ncbi:hypothetical protein CWN93_08700 [Vibrio splendidus]|nr:hypothetical protein CWN93_08700 [Vibrio splendidus]
MSTAWTTFVQKLFAIDGSLWGNISNAFSEAWKILKEGFANLFPDLSGMFDFDFFGDDDTPEETSKKEKERIDNAGKYQQGSYAPPASSATVYGYGMQTQYPPKVAEQAEKNIQAETKKAESMMHESVVPEVNAIEVERKNALAKEQSMDVLKTANIGEKTGNAYVDQDKLNNWLDKKTIPEVERKLSQYLDLVFDESKRMLGYQDQYYINMAAGIQDHLSTRLGDLEGTPSFHQQAMTEEVKPASFSDSLISNAPSVMTVEPINTPLVEPPLAAPVQQVQEPIVQEVLTRDDVRSEVQGAMKDQSREQETQNRLDADAIGKAVAAELKPEMQQTNSYMAMQVGLVEDGNRQLRKNGNGGIRPVN